MSVLSNYQIERLINDLERQLEDGRILYENRLIETTLDKPASRKKEISALKPDDYAQSWILLNLPQIQSDRSVIQEQHRKISEEKLEYYSRNNNMAGLWTWLHSLLTNIGFTDNQARRFTSAVNRIGEVLYKKSNNI